jgi:hypothetical protein
MLKQKNSFQKFKHQIIKIITLVVSYMHNKYIALLPISGLVPIFFAKQIYNNIKNFLNFDINGELSFELILTLLITTSAITLLTCSIYVVFELTTEYIIKISKRTKDEIIKVYRDVYCLEQKVDNADKNTISYFVAIEIIKTSAFGVHTKHQAIVTGTLKERGGKYVEKHYTLKHVFSGEKFSEYIPTSEELLEEKKEELIYQKILIRFFKESEKYNGGNVTRLIINKNELADFLFKKQLEIQ